MTTTQGDLAELSRYVFRAPSWYSSLGFSLVIAALAGIAAFDFRFVLEDAWQGIFFIGVPTIVASALTPYVDRKLGGQLTPNGSSLLALVGELLIVAVLVVAGVIAVVAPSLGGNFVFDALMAGLASVFALRLLVVMAVSRRSLPVASIPASIQTVAGALLVFVYSGTMRYVEVGGPLVRSYLSRPEQAPPELLYVVPGDFLLLAITCLLYGGGVFVFLHVIDQPWRRAMGVSVLDFVRGFVGHIAEDSRELENFFERIGEEAVVPVTVLSVRRVGSHAGEPSAGARVRAGSEKARFVLPMVHPGPMGEIGGGNLPVRIARQSEGLAFPPHATAGHDFNLVTSREVDTVLDAVESAQRRIDYSPAATRSVRVEEGEASLLAQAFDENALVTATYAPGYADDVAYAVGLSAKAEVRSTGLREVMLADAHNCNDGLTGGDLGHVSPGSTRSFDMMQAAGRAGAILSAAERAPVRIGVAWDETDWVPSDGIGPLGVRVAVVEVDGQQTGYVLIDGNNMDPGVRERLLDAVELDRAEVMTTDTHVVNTVDAANQVGAAIDIEELADLVADLVEAARADLEPVVTGMETQYAEVTVFGTDRTEALASHANAMISMGSALAAAVVIALASISVLLFFVT